MILCQPSESPWGLRRLHTLKRWSVDVDRILTTEWSVFGQRQQKRHTRTEARALRDTVDPQVKRELVLVICSAVSRPMVTWPHPLF